MIHIGFTGTQVGMTDAQAERLSELLASVWRSAPDGFVGHHGLCIGSDIQFDAIARQAPGFLGMVIHPCDLPLKQGRVPLNLLRDAVRAIKKPLVRNRDIVKESDVLIATPYGSEQKLRSGTWTTVRYALKAGKPIAVILPFGQLLFDGPAWPWLPYR